MKRVFAFVLTLAMLVPMVCSVGIVANADDYTAKPFYGAGWSDINRIKFPNLEGMAVVALKDLGDGTLGLSYASKTSPKDIAASLKKYFDRTPEGMRHLFLSGTSNAFSLAPEDAIFMENGVGQMKALFTELINEYKALGGQLDSLVLDTEYVNMSSWYLYTKFYGPLYTPTNPAIYKQIVENPKYATMIRPLLVERGFVFYDNPSGNKSEIGSAFPYQYLSTFLGTKNIAKYANSATVWNAVMGIHLANYLNDALLEPLMACYPDAIMSDYQEDDVDAWLKSLSDTGGIRGYYGGNGTKVGNASNYNTYASRPSGTFYKDGSTYVYKNLPAFNNAVYEDDPYHMFLFDANKFKQMYAATDNKKITAWIAEYDYSTRAGSVSNTPYYTETLYHLGMLNPETFLIYIWSGDSKFKGSNGTAEYNKRMQTISEVLNELTRVAGYSDRKPIETPASWNDGFVLSGMYAGGRNIWRITPDTTEGTTLEEFMVKDQAPTFSINGTTVVFPQGRIISDSAVSVVGSAGYWVETPKNVNPVIVRDADRYSKNPSFVEDFSDYTDGTVFNSTNALPQQTWEVTASKNLLVQNGALTLTGTADLKNVTLPKNISAGDTYAKQQAWEISFTLDSAMNSGANVKLLTCGSDGGVKLEGGKVYYDQNGTYKEFAGVTLSVGQKYTVKREVNFTVDGAYTSTYSLYKGGTLVKQAAGVPMKSVTLPVSSIGIACNDLTAKVSLDDYKLYPTGLATDFEVYNAESGIRLEADAKNSAKRVAYRLSWLNGANAGRKVNVKVAQYNSAGSLVSEKIVRTVEMAPGCDGVETGIVQNTGGKVVVYLEDAGTYTPSKLPNYDNGDFNWGSDEPATLPTDQPTTLPDLPDEPLPTAPPSQPRETEPSVVPSEPSYTQATVAPSQPAATNPTTGTNQGTATKPTTGANQGAATNPTTDSNQGTATKPTTDSNQGTATNPTTDSNQDTATKPTTGANQDTATKPTTGTNHGTATKVTIGANHGAATKVTIGANHGTATKVTIGANHGTATKVTISMNQGTTTKPTTDISESVATDPTTDTNQGAVTRPTTGTHLGTIARPTTVKPTKEPDEGLVVNPITRPTQGSGDSSVIPTGEYEDPSVIPTGGYDDPSVFPTGENENPSVIPTGEYDDPSMIPSGEYEDPSVIPTEGDGQEISPTEPNGNEEMATNPVDTEEPDHLDEEPQVKKGLSGGTITLIVVGVLLVVGGIAAAIVFYLKKKKATKPTEE